MSLLVGKFEESLATSSVLFRRRSEISAREGIANIHSRVPDQWRKPILSIEEAA